MLTAASRSPGTWSGGAFYLNFGRVDNQAVEHLIRKNLDCVNEESEACLEIYLAKAE